MKDKTEMQALIAYLQGLGIKNEPAGGLGGTGPANDGGEP